MSYVLNGITFAASSDFAPIPGLFSSEGDLILTFLFGNGVEFLERTDDPWYRGNVPAQNVRWDGIVYRMDQAASPMACLRQYQFCNPALPEEGRCGLLTGFAEAQYQAAPLFNITRDQMFNITIEQMVKKDIPQTPAAARYIWLVILLTLTVPSPATLINIRGPNSLASQQSLTRSSSMLGSIPSNQWQLDVENWWAIYMASLQAGMVNIAYGSHDPALKPYEIPPSTPMPRSCATTK